MSQELWPWNCESPKEKCPKAIPRHFQNHVVWLWALECSVKSYVIEPLNKMLFSMNFHSCEVLTHVKITMNQRLWDSRVPWSPGFVLVLPPRGGFWKESRWPWRKSIWCHVGIHVDFTSILHSRTPLAPYVWCEVNLDRLRLFHQWELLKCNCHGLSVSSWFGNMVGGLNSTTAY